MLSREQNELLVQVGPGTPMGDLFRRYWMPALLAEELPEPDCPPVRVKLLGEDLIAFRDTNGPLGLIDEFCPHRGASLFFGRNEEGGLRCVYHGWKFDVAGNCVDMPSEPEGSAFKDKIKLTRLHARGARRRPLGLHGPARTAAAAARARVGATARTRTGSSRSGGRRPTGSRRSRAASTPATSRLPTGSTSTTTRCTPAPQAWSTSRPTRGPSSRSPSPTAGCSIGARRNVDDEQYYWRLTQCIMPWYTIIPPFGTHNPMGGARLGADRRRELLGLEHQLPPRPAVCARTRSPPCGRARASTSKYIPGTFRPVANKSNDYLIDREAQRKQEDASAASRASPCRTPPCRSP